jgi:hypothetical protein
MSDEVEKKTRKQYKVSAEDFVKVWNHHASRNGSVKDVSEELGMPVNIVLGRKANYTKQRPDGSPGVKLLPMKRSNSRSLDVEKLNKVAEEAATTTE